VTQAQQITADSTRLALVPAMAAFNAPTLALEFLRKENQSRSTFKLDSTKTMNGALVAIVKFSEQSKPHLLPGPDDATAQGRFWIDAASGTVRQTELLYTSKAIDVRSTVVFAADAASGLWLPVSLDATYNITGGGSGSSTMGQGTDNLNYGSRQTIDSQVRYSKFKQTKIDLAKLAK
jgi:hypothetical protein